MSEAEVRAALERVNDPHVPVSLRRMGMLRRVEIEGDGAVRVQLCIPCLGCPGLGMLHGDIREALSRLDGVTSVVIDDGWHLAWSRDMVDQPARELMRANGIQI